MEGGGYMHKQQSTLIVILKLVFGGLTSVVLIVLGTANLQSGEGNGNLLQYSCLENPVDSGAWRAAVHGVEQSRTRLKRCSSSNLQSEDQFVSASLRSSLTIESAVVMATVLLSCTWEGTKGPWLCLITKLLVFSLVGLFSFVSAFSHFSD